MSKGMRTEDEVRDSAKLILGFDKTEDGVQQGKSSFALFLLAHLCEPNTIKIVR